MSRLRDAKGSPGNSPEDLWKLVQYKMIEAFNRATEEKHSGTSYECWPVRSEGEEGGHSNWIVFIITDAYTRLPQARDDCFVRIDESNWFEATRMDNPYPPIFLRNQEQSFVTFRVKVPINGTESRVFKPLEMSNDADGGPRKPVVREGAKVWANLRLKAKLASQLNEQVSSKRVPDPSWKFDNTKAFYDIYRFGIKTEFAFEEAATLKFNSESVYKSWLITKHWSDDKRHQHFIVLVASACRHECFPRVGDQCELGFAVEIPEPESDKIANGRTCTEYNPKRPNVWYHKAFRIDNPTNKFDLHDMKWDDCSTFRISVDRKDTQQTLTLDEFSFQLYPDDIEQERKRGRSPLIALCDETAFETHVWLDISDTTLNIELNALECAASAPVDGRVGQAFSYIRDFNDTVPRVNLFESFPHMKEPDSADGKLPENVKALYRDLDDDQKAVWNNTLSDLPAGIGIIPGGTNTGKTHLMMTISALLLSRKVPSSSGKTDGPVLFIMEANRLVNDAANKMCQIFERLGRDEVVVVRGYNINYEGKYGTQRLLKLLSDKESLESIFEEWFPTQRADHLPQIYQGRKDQCQALTLDDLIQQTFFTYRAEFSNLADWVETGSLDLEETGLNLIYQAERDNLLRKVLSTIDVLVVTFPGAAKIARFCEGFFQPTVVICDEAARSGDPSTLVPISNFPTAQAWLFTGTCELSKPYVGSFGNRSQWNPCHQQLRTSMMERAQNVVPNMLWLSLNHQTYGNLQDLPSKFFWNGKIRSAIPESERVPAPTRHLLQFLQQFNPGRELTVPRLLVHTEQTVRDREAKSKYNSNHVEWVVQRLIRDLAQDPDFRSADGKEPGSIVVVTPYRAQLTNYSKAIKILLGDLDKDHRADGNHGQGLHREMRIEARSSDTVQSHSADLVVLDLVHWHVTDHNDDRNRLAVSLTRAKQAEVIIMHKGMLRSRSWTGSLVQRLYRHCKDEGQVVNVSMRDHSSVEKNYTLDTGGSGPGNGL